MRIAQVINSLGVGGAERIALQLHGRYLAAGYRSSLVALAGEVPEAQPGVRTLGLGSPYSPLSPAALADMPPDAGLYDADVVHAHLFPAQLAVPLALPPARGRRVLVTTEHNTSNRRRGTLAGKLVDRLAYREYELIACVSESVSDAMVGWLPWSGPRLRTVPNGIDLRRFRPAPARPSPDEPVLLSVGRLTEAKNHEAGLRAIAELRRMGYPVTYRIAGSGPLGERIRIAAGELGISSCVELLGDVRDVPSRMASATAMLLPSRWEGFGLVVAEAMASGLPVVASDLPPVREVLGPDGECGYLVPSGDASAMAERVALLLDDPGLRERMGACGVGRARMFDIDATAEEYLALYREAMERGK